MRSASRWEGPGSPTPRPPSGAAGAPTRRPTRPPRGSRSCPACASGITDGLSSPGRSASRRRKALGRARSSSRTSGAGRRGPRRASCRAARPPPPGPTRLAGLPTSIASDSSRSPIARRPFVPSVTPVDTRSTMRVGKPQPRGHLDRAGERDHVDGDPAGRRTSAWLPPAWAVATRRPARSAISRCGASTGTAAASRQRP